MSSRLACPCCGYRTLHPVPPGGLALCPVCFWEDDPRQSDDPDFIGGVNVASLREAQANFRRYGAYAWRYLPHVRLPKPDEPRDEAWKALGP